GAPMTLLSRLFSYFSGKAACKSSRRPAVSNRWQPMLEDLECRTVPSTLSWIKSNFNGTAIPAGDTLWFNSVFKASGVGSNTVTIHVTNQTITFTAAGTPYTVNVPDSIITLSPSTTADGATTTFDTNQNAWVTNVPSSFSGNAFLGGVS